MDYGQSNCKNYFNLNTNTFYYEPQFNGLNQLNQLNDSTNSSLNNQKGFSDSYLDGSFNTSTDYSFKQPFYDASNLTTSVDVFCATNNNLDDAYSEELYYKQFGNHNLTSNLNSSLNHQYQSHHHYPLSSNYLTENQNELTSSVLINSNSNQLQSSQQFNSTSSTQNNFNQSLQPVLNSSLHSIAPLHIQANQTASSQQTTKQLSVNLSMNMTMDIKSMDFKSISNSNQTSSSNSADYNYVMNDVVSNVANKLVNNFNPNLLSPSSNQKDFSTNNQIYTHQSYQNQNQPSKNQYAFYNHSSNYNRNYQNSIPNQSTYYVNDSSSATNHFLTQCTNSSLDDLNNQFKHFNNQNWTDNTSNNTLTSLSSSNNLNSLGSSFSNGSFSASDEVNDNEYLISYSNEFINSISKAESDCLQQSKLTKRKQLINLENDGQKIYFKIENNQNDLKHSKEKQDNALRLRSNENNLHRLDYELNEKLDKKMRSINKNGNLCSLCGKSYARPSTLKTHLRTHLNERPYRCSTCLKSFSQAANLTAHLRTHSGEKPFQCSICSRRFSQSSSVTTHMRTHSGERPYRCGRCNKAFSDSSTLTKHLRIHSGEKPYQCQLCLLRFSQSGNLNRHMRIHSFQ